MDLFVRKSFLQHCKFCFLACLDLAFSLCSLLLVLSLSPAFFHMKNHDACSFHDVMLLS